MSHIRLQQIFRVVNLSILLSGTVSGCTPPSPPENVQSVSPPPPGATSCPHNDWDLQLVDSFGDGWNGNTLSILSCDYEELASGLTLDSGSSGTEDVCLLPSSTGYIIECGGGSFASEVTWTLSDQWGSTILTGGVGTINGCGPAPPPPGPPCADQAFYLHMEDDYGDGWNGNELSVSTCGTGGTTGETLVSGLTLGEGSSGIADVCVPYAESGYVIYCGGGNYAAEVSWSFLDAGGQVVASGGTGTMDFCDTPCSGNSWDVHLADSFGDGWNGNSMTIYNCVTGATIEDGITLGSGSSGSADVCLPPSEDGYSITVGGGSYVDEISWTLLDETGSIIAQAESDEVVDQCVSPPPPSPPAICTGAEWDIHLVDSFGDGWNGASLSATDCSGLVLASGITLGEGSTGVADVCIPSTVDGYIITAGGGNYDSEISWTLIDQNNVAVLSGGAGQVAECPTGFSCSGNDWDLHLADSYGDGWNGNELFVRDCAGNTVVSGITLDSGYVHSADVCLPPPQNYIISCGGGSYGSEVTWTLFEEDGTVVVEGSTGEVVVGTCAGYVSNSDSNLVPNQPNDGTSNEWQVNNTVDTVVPAGCNSQWQLSVTLGVGQNLECEAWGGSLQISASNGVGFSTPSSGGCASVNAMPALSLYGNLDYSYDMSLAVPGASFTVKNAAGTVLLHASHPPDGCGSDGCGVHTGTLVPCSVSASLILIGDIQDVQPPGGETWQAFSNTFKTGVADALSVTPGLIQIIDIYGGSIVVDFVVLPESDTVGIGVEIVSTVFGQSGVSIGDWETAMAVRNVQSLENPATSSSSSGPQARTAECEYTCLGAESYVYNFFFFSAIISLLSVTAVWFLGEKLDDLVDLKFMKFQHMQVMVKGRGDAFVYLTVLIPSCIPYLIASAYFKFNCVQEEMDEVVESTETEFAVAMTAISGLLVLSSLSFAYIAYRVGPGGGTPKEQLTFFSLAVVGGHSSVLIIAIVYLSSAFASDTGHVFADIECPVVIVGETPATAGLICDIDPSSNNFVQGSYEPPVGSYSTCDSCQPGYFCCNSPFTSELGCQQCSAGSAQPSRGGLGCTECTAGQYAEDLGNRECALCAAGKYSEDRGATEPNVCGTCRSGTSSAAGAAACGECSAGTYGDLDAPGTCADCPANTYLPVSGANGTNASACQACSLGKFSEVAAQECTVCENGTMWNEDNMRCAVCPFPNRCKLGLCTPGSVGPGCASCNLEVQPPWFQAGKECLRCPDQMPAWFLGAATFIMVGFIYGIWRISSVKGMDDFETVQGNSDAAKELQAGKQSVSQVAILLGIGFPHLQLMAFLSELPMGWPESFKNLGSYLMDLVSFDFGQLYSPECRVSGDVDNDSMYVVKFLTTHGVFLFFLVVLLFPQVLKQCDPDESKWADLTKQFPKIFKPHGKGYNQKVAEHSSNALSALFTLFALTLVRSCGMALNCTADSDGIFRLDAMPGIVCTLTDTSSVYIQLTLLSVVCLTFYGLFSFFKLRALKNGHAAAEKHIKDHQPNHEDVLTYQRTHGWLVLKYKHDVMWYAEFMILAHRIFIVVTSLLFSSEGWTVVRVLLHSAVTVALLAWVVIEKPFAQPGKDEEQFSDGDKLEIVTMCSLLVAEALGLICHLAPEYSSGALEVVLVFVTLIPLVMAIVQIFVGKRNAEINKSRFKQQCVVLRKLNTSINNIETGTAKSLARAARDLAHVDSEHMTLRNKTRPLDDFTQGIKDAYAEEQDTEILRDATEEFDLEEYQDVINGDRALPRGARVRVSALSHTKGAVKAEDTDIIIEAYGEWKDALVNAGAGSLTLVKTEKDEESGDRVQTKEHITYEYTRVTKDDEGEFITLAGCKRGTVGGSNPPISFTEEEVKDQFVKTTARIHLFAGNGLGTYRSWNGGFCSRKSHSIEFDDETLPDKVDIGFNTTRDKEGAVVRAYEILLCSPHSYIMKRVEFYQILSSSLSLVRDTTDFIKSWHSDAVPGQIHLEEMLVLLNEKNDGLTKFEESEYAAVVPAWKPARSNGHQVQPQTVSDLKQELHELSSTLKVFGLKGNANKAFASKKYEDATEQYLEALRLDPKNKHIVSAYEEILELEDKNSDFRKAQQAKDSGNFDGAISSLVAATHSAKSLPENLRRHIATTQAEVVRAKEVAQKASEASEEMDAANQSRLAGDLTDARTKLTAAVTHLNEAQFVAPGDKFIEELLVVAKREQDQVMRELAQNRADKDIEAGDLIAEMEVLKQQLEVEGENQKVQAQYAHTRVLKYCSDAEQLMLQAKYTDAKDTLREALDIEKMSKQDQTSLDTLGDQLETRVILHDLGLEMQRSTATIAADSAEVTAAIAKEDDEKKSKTLLARVKKKSENKADATNEQPTELELAEDTQDIEVAGDEVKETPKQKAKRVEQEKEVAARRAATALNLEKLANDEATADKLHQALFWAPSTISSEHTRSTDDLELQQKSKELFDRGEEHLHECNWAEAIEEFKAAFDLEHAIHVEDDAGRLAMWAARILVMQGYNRSTETPPNVTAARESYNKANQQVEVSAKLSTDGHHVHRFFAHKSVTAIDGDIGTIKKDIKAKLDILDKLEHDKSVDAAKLEHERQDAHLHKFVLTSKKAMKAQDYDAAERALVQAKQINSSHKAVKLAILACTELQVAKDRQKNELMRRGHSKRSLGDHESAANLLREANLVDLDDESESVSAKTKRETARRLFDRTHARYTEKHKDDPEPEPIFEEEIAADDESGGRRWGASKASVADGIHFVNPMISDKEDVETAVYVSAGTDPKGTGETAKGKKSKKKGGGKKSDQKEQAVIVTNPLWPGVDSTSDPAGELGNKKKDKNKAKKQKKDKNKAKKQKKNNKTKKQEQRGAETSDTVEALE